MIYNSVIFPCLVDGGKTVLCAVVDTDVIFKGSIGLSARLIPENECYMNTWTFYENDIFGKFDF